MKSSPAVAAWGVGRLQVGTIAYAYGVNGSFEHPRPAGVEQLISLVDKTTQDAPITFREA